MKLSTNARQFLDAKAAGSRYTGGKITASTAGNYSTQLSRVERVMGKPIAELTEEDIDTMLLRLQETGISESSVNLVITALRSFFTWALKTHQPIAATENPMDEVKMTSTTRMKHKVPRVIREDQFQRILKEIEKEDRIQEENALATSKGPNLPWVNDPGRLQKKLLPYKLMFYAGLRISEAAELEVDDVVDHGVVIDGKEAKQRFVPLPPWLLDELTSYVAEFGGETYVFTTTQREGREEAPLNRSFMHALFRRGVQAAGLPEWVKPHTLRHSFATQAMNRTKRLDIVQDLLGHENPSTTRIYLNNRNEDLVKQATNIWDPTPGN